MEKGLYLCCNNCGNQIYRTNNQILKSKSDVFFCSRKCTAEYYGNKTKTNYRKEALKHYGCICENCSYSEDVRLLDVHHIDENRDNNNIENLIVLCVMCHAKLTRKVSKLINRKLVDKTPNLKEKEMFYLDCTNVYCFDKDNNLIDIFYSMDEIIEWIKSFKPNPNRKIIYDCISKERKSAYGFKFEIKD